MQEISDCFLQNLSVLIMSSIFLTGMSVFYLTHIPILPIYRSMGIFRIFFSRYMYILKNSNQYLPYSYKGIEVISDHTKNFFPNSTTFAIILNWANCKNLWRNSQQPEKLITIIFFFNGPSKIAWDSRHYCAIPHVSHID